MKPFTVELPLERETKGTYLFSIPRDAVADEGVVSVYVRKVAIDGPAPKAIKITVEPVAS